MKYTDPRSLGNILPVNSPRWPFLLLLTVALVSLYLGYYSISFLLLIPMVFMVVQTTAVAGMIATTDIPTIPPLGNANIKATFVRRVSTYRYACFLTEPHDELLFYLSLSEVAKERLKKAGYYDATFYVLDLRKNYSKIGNIIPETQVLYRLKDMVEKAPFIYTNNDINILNKVENELREEVAKIGGHIKILDDERARSGSDTVEF